MYENIVVALGLGHGHGSTSFDLARRLKSPGGKITAVHVLEPVPGFVKYYIPVDHADAAEKAAKEQMSKRIGDANDVELVTLSGNPGIALIEFAEASKADCIIVGSHKPELSDYLLGSTAARVVRHAPCSVHVLR
ncbi:MAG: universal stress protein [Pseudomonadota bacterium]